MDKTFEKIYEEYNKESAAGENQALFEKVYAEAEMLNEMNPKLKALLAAGLIGTAGLGMQSCSNPSDSVYCPYTVVAPSTDNPGSGGGTENLGNGGGAETSNPSGGEENGGNGGETVDKFKELGVTDEDDVKRLKNVTPIKHTGGFVFYDKDEKGERLVNHVYMGKESGFKKMDKSDAIPILYKDVDDLPYRSEGHVYHIPANMKDDFIAAGASL